MQPAKDYGTITPSSSSSNTNSAGNSTAHNHRVNIIRNRIFSYCDDPNCPNVVVDGDDDNTEATEGLYSSVDDHVLGCDKRWIRVQRSSKSNCCGCNNADQPQQQPQCADDDVSKGTKLDEDLEDEELPRHVKGSQRWRNVKAVMAYYYALRKIKRNVAFVFETQFNQDLACYSMVFRILIDVHCVLSKSTHTLTLYTYWMCCLIDLS